MEERASYSTTPARKRAETTRAQRIGLDRIDVQSGVPALPDTSCGGSRVLCVLRPDTACGGSSRPLWAWAVPPIETSDRSSQLSRIESKDRRDETPAPCETNHIAVADAMDYTSLNLG